MPEASRTPSNDPFSIMDGGALMQGFTTWAAVWAAPWKAAFIVAEEAMRHGHGPARDTDA